MNNQKQFNMLKNNCKKIKTVDRILFLMVHGYLHTIDCFFQVSIFFLWALVKWSQTFLWQAAMNNRSIWLTNRHTQIHFIKRLYIFIILKMDNCNCCFNFYYCNPDKEMHSKHFKKNYHCFLQIYFRGCSITKKIHRTVQKL